MFWLFVGFGPTFGRGGPLGVGVGVICAVVVVVVWFAVEPLVRMKSAEGEGRRVTAGITSTFSGSFSSFSSRVCFSINAVALSLRRGSQCTKRETSETKKKGKGEKNQKNC